jgi:hypothetical protein
VDNNLPFMDSDSNCIYFNTENSYIHYQEKVLKKSGFTIVFLTVLCVGDRDCPMTNDCIREPPHDAGGNQHISSHSTSPKCCLINECDIIDVGVMSVINCHNLMAKERTVAVLP